MRQRVPGILYTALVLCSSAHAGTFTPPKLYAAMFDKGRRWTYDVSTTVRLRDGTRTMETRETSVLTCEVIAVKTYAAAVASQIACDRSLDSDYAFVPDGLWVATATGLGRLPYFELPDAIDNVAPVIAAAPHAMSKHTKTDFGGAIVEKVFASGRAWCTSEDSLGGGAGDGAITTLCFRPGGGLAWGELDYRGGDPRDVIYTAR